MTASEYTFGDIVLLAFPFTDSKQKKKRPALVLLDANDNDVVLCRITSQTPETKYDFKIDGWKNYGLLLPSCIRLHKVATLEKQLIERKLGKLNEQTKAELKNVIANLLHDFLK